MLLSGFLLCDGFSAAPNEVRVLTSPDGANMEEAACWRKTGKADDSFVETLEFNRPRGLPEIISAVQRVLLLWSSVCGKVPIALRW